MFMSVVRLKSIIFSFFFLEWSNDMIYSVYILGIRKALWFIFNFLCKKYTMLPVKLEACFFNKVTASSLLS